MLDPKKTASTNKVTIVGTLNELSIEEKMTGDGRAYVSGKASIRVDQEIGGKKVENIIPVHMFSMRKKKDGTNNVVYDRIVKLKDEMTSLAAADEPCQASRVLISGGQIKENMWLDQTTGEVKKNFQIESNFMKKAKDEDEECGVFEMTGVVANMRDEVNKEGDETGRLKINFVTFGWLGKADVIELIVENSNAVDFIKNNWEVEDTVSLTGVINMTFKTETWMEEQGFGEPIKRTRTISARELIVTGGSPSGLDEAFSYDANDVKAALEERKKREQEKLNEKTVVHKPTNGFGF